VDILWFIKDLFWSYNSFFYFCNTIEIVFFSLLFYYFSLWLGKDQQKNLLPYFYGYCFIVLGAYFVQLTTISYFLLLFAPVAIMLFILLHQELLQKNFVAFKNIRPATPLHLEWAGSFIRSCLIAINNDKEIHCVIEQQDKLDDFIQAPLIIKANINQQLLKILHDSKIFEPQKMIWLNVRGSIIGINSIWKNDIDKELLSEENKILDKWTQHALVLSSKIDALFLRITPLKRSFEIIFNGKRIDNVNAKNTLNIIKKYISTDFWTKKPTLNKEEIFEHGKKNNFTESAN